MKVIFGIYAVGVVLAVVVTSLMIPRGSGGPRVELSTVLPGYEPRPLTPVTSMYRGDPAHSGLSALPVPLGLTPATLAAKANIGVHSAAKASPAVDASGVYVPTDGGYLYAFAHDGTQRWQVKVANAGNGIHGTPLLDGERVYIGAYNGRLYAFDKHDGRPLWVAALGAAIGASPTPDGDDLLVTVETNTPDGYVVRLGRADGHVVWTSQWLGEQSHASPTIIGDALYLGANNGYFFAFDKRDGRLLWRTRVDGDVKATACAVGEVLVASRNDGVVFGLRMSDGELLWGRHLGSEARSSAACLASAGLAFVTVGVHQPTNGWGTAYALDGATGEVRWQAPEGEGRPLMSPLLAPDPASGRVAAWFRCDSDRLCAYDAVSGLRLSSVPMGGVLTGAPVVCDGGLVVSLDHPGGVVRLLPPSGGAVTP